MGKRPKLDKIVSKMEAGKDFTLSRSQYLQLTGTDIPQNRSYTEKQSAVAKCAKEHGYVVVVIPEVLEFIKKS